MKYRLITLVILLTLLTACSLAEDITPPPGYQAPPPTPSLVPATEMPAPTLEEPTSTVASEPTIAEAQITPSIDITATPGSVFGNISGKIDNGSTGVIPEGQKVTLVWFDKDPAGNYQMTSQLEATVNSDGSYAFNGAEVPKDRAFILYASMEGVEYQSDPVIATGTSTDYSIPLTIYEASGDLNELSFTQVHLFFDASTQNEIQVTELFIVSNLGKQTITVASDGTSIPFIQIPKNASNLQFQLSQGSASILNATGGFAMPPGMDKQYGFVATYGIPYTNGLQFDQAFTLPASSLTVLLQNGMRLRSEQLASAGTQDLQGQTYQIFQANKIVSGSTLSLTLSGKPGATSGFTLDRQTMIVISLGMVGVLLVGLGILLFLRDRKRLKREYELNEESGDDALGDDRDSILDAMIALDDQYKAGEIPKEAYEQRRSDLKKRLKKTL